MKAAQDVYLWLIRLLNLWLVLLVWLVTVLVGAALKTFFERIGGQAATEMLQNASRIAQRILCVSLRALPVEDRDRYLEELTAELEAKVKVLGETSPLSLLAEALRLGCALVRMGLQFRLRVINACRVPPQFFERPIGSWMLWLVVIGQVLGAGIYFLMNEVAARAAGLTWLSFAVGLGIMLPTAHSLAGFVVTYPSSAGARLYAKIFPNSFVAFLAAYAFVATNIAVVSTSAVVVSSYLNELVPVSLPLVVLPLIVITTMGFASSRSISRSMQAFLGASVLLEVAGLLGIIGVGVAAMARGMGNPSNILVAPQGENIPFAIFGGALLSAYALLGFENSVILTQETKDRSQRTFPRALIGGVWFTGILYVLLAIVAVMVIGPDRLAQSELGLLEVAEVASTVVPSWLFVSVALTAVANTGLIAFFMASRLLHGMAMEEMVSGVFGYVPARRRRCSVVAIVFVWVIASGMTLAGEADLLADTAVALLLAVFAAINVSALTLRKRSTTRVVIVATRVVPALGTVLCLILLAQQQREVWVRAGVLVVVGLCLWIANRPASHGPQSQTRRLLPRD